MRTLTDMYNELIALELTHQALSLEIAKRKNDVSILYSTKGIKSHDEHIWAYKAYIAKKEFVSRQARRLISIGMSREEAIVQGCLAWQNKKIPETFWLTPEAGFKPLPTVCEVKFKTYQGKLYQACRA